MYFSITKRKKRFVVFASLAAVILLMLRPGILLSKKSAMGVQEAITPKEDSSKIPLNYIFSVAVEDRHFYLARKLGKGQYELINVPPYHELSLCQSVKTTGFDYQFNPDVTIGVISSIEFDPNELHPTVIISQHHHCS